jgi:methylglutaconyl-CoA hydratase
MTREWQELNGGATRPHRKVLPLTVLPLPVTSRLFRDRYNKSRYPILCPLMDPKVLSQVDADGNATVVLNRPEVHNAFDPEMVDALTATLRQLESRADVRAIVVTGTGRNFCAGADIEQMKRSATYTREQNLELARATALMLQTLYTLEKPTIACVRGAARGGGVGLISACDIALAERGATFRLSEVRLGIIAAEAYRIGLVHDICEEPELNAQVGRMLAQLHSSGPRAVVAIKKLIPEIAAAAIDDAVSEKTAQRIAELRTTPEAQEGLGAFLEKRKPSWTAAAPDKSGKETNRHDAGKNKNRN